MIKYYCDLCGKESQKLKYHDWTQFVQISAVLEMGDDTEFFARFHVCDGCKDIWNHFAKIFIQDVRDAVKVGSPI